MDQKLDDVVRRVANIETKQDNIGTALGEIKAELAAGNQRFSGLEDRLKEEVDARAQGDKDEKEAREALTGRMLGAAGAVAGVISTLVAGFAAIFQPK